MRLEAHARTDPGPVREHNEDAFLVDVDAGLFIVADGMGGHASGEVASALAVEAVSDVLLGEIDPDETRLDRAEPDGHDAIRERLRYAMNQASLRIRRAAMQNPEHTGMGTTVCVLLVEDGVAHLGHVGDSRIYLFRDGKLQRLTRDHTVVQQEIDAGRLTPKLARIVPHKNILTQSVGYHGPVEPDTSTRPVRAGDIFVMCSDGLTDPIDDDGLAVLLAQGSLDELAENLTQAALDAGADDNITIVVVGVVDD
ncbi:MAG: serine/threonine-protein phosphatase [Alphaproteobacteria bacterium]|nr:serine/threonine-protein phosphatase [Alphaproteobacteria bacterium]